MTPTNCSHLGAPDPSPEHITPPLLKLLSHRGQMSTRLRFSHSSDFQVTRTRPPDIWRSDVAPDRYHPNHKELPDGGRPGLRGFILLVGGGSVYLMLKNLLLRALMFTVSTLTLHCSVAQIRPRLIP